MPTILCIAFDLLGRLYSGIRSRSLALFLYRLFMNVMYIIYTKSSILGRNFHTLLRDYSCRVEILSLFRPTMDVTAVGAGWPTHPGRPVRGG